MEIGKAEFDAFLNEMRSFKDEVRLGFDKSIASLEGFRIEVTSKLDGIGSFLLKSENNLLMVEDRVTKLENRVNRLETG
jgi:hypothetical protein